MSHHSFAHALLDPSLPVPAGLVLRGGGNLAERFAVHRNNTFVSLVDALLAIYPVTAELVGEPFFRSMAAVYVRQSPPRQPVLVRYAADFDHFIAQFEPAESVPYLPSVARIEAACMHSLHAADAISMGVAAVAEVIADGETLLRRGCRLDASLVPLSLSHAGADVWMAHQPGSDRLLSTIDTDRPQNVLVHRSGDGVVVWEPPVGTIALVRLLMDGVPLARAVDAVGLQHDNFDFSISLAGLLHHGLVVDLPLGNA
jgi:hypothetical protein